MVGTRREHNLNKPMWPWNAEPTPPTRPFWITSLLDTRTIPILFIEDFQAEGKGTLLRVHDMARNTARPEIKSMSKSFFRLTASRARPLGSV